MSIVRQGWLEKCGPKWSPTWNLRWLVLYDTRVIEYFKDADKKELKGIIELEGFEKVSVAQDSDKGKNYDHAFSLQTKSRNYKFASETRRDREGWVKALTDVVKGTLKRDDRLKRKASKKTHSKHKSVHMNHGVLRHVQSVGTVTGKASGGKKNPLGILEEGTAAAGGHRGGSVSASGTHHSRAQSFTTEKPLAFDFDELKDVDAHVTLKMRSDLFQGDLGRDVWKLVTSFLSLQQRWRLADVSKWIRSIAIANVDWKALLKEYEFKLLPLEALKRYAPERSPKYPYIFAHHYKQIWVFGNVETWPTYAKSGIDQIERVYLDDFQLWSPIAKNLASCMNFIQNHVSESCIALSLRSFHLNSEWIDKVPRLSKILSMTCSMYLQPSILSVSSPMISTKRLHHLELNRVDMISNDLITGEYLSKVFASMTSLLCLNLTESRWKHSINVPAQVKFLRYVPSDFSVIDLARLVDDSAMHTLPYDLNYACDIIINHRNWPSVLNSSIVNGHEALQGRRLRVWVLKKKRKWDKQVMNVNYCMRPPPLKLFERNNCFDDLSRLDSAADMSAFWKPLWALESDDEDEGGDKRKKSKKSSKKKRTSKKKN